MKIIHCADIHLDSRMTSNLKGNQAKERKHELIGTFLKMIEYAVGEGVSAIIIAGDLFDTDYFSSTTANEVVNAITSHPGIAFYYLKGNHGGGDRFINELDEIPSNLYLFGNEWKTYILSDNGRSKITLSGIELVKENSGTACAMLNLDPDDLNIVTLHGQAETYNSEHSPEAIGLNELRNKSIDYLALGHFHEYQTGDIPPRGTYCYCGCLEGRGFDECGRHGFILLDINDDDHRDWKYELKDISKRKIFELKVDISDCTDTPGINNRILASAAENGCSENDLVKVVLTGSVDMDCEKNIEYLTQKLNEKFYFAKVEDKTKILIDYADYELEASLKGEFVRLVRGDESIGDEEKAEIIRYGIKALNGEDFE
ncbi:MAG: metallophosphoesterase [Lachnospiraceae bacterium]|nr:metallophosphoesterase [Lachnospiraceae bacterium]